jgi:hypothetical protein
VSISTISIPITTKQFLELVAHLNAQNSDRDPVEAIHAAIDAWMNITKPRPESEAPINTQFQTSTEGYWWKSVFLPKGSKIKMPYKGKVFLADVSGEGVVYQGATMSPSNFVYQATGTNRNAWHDIEVQFPGTQKWVPADSLRFGVS